MERINNLVLRALETFKGEHSAGIVENIIKGDYFITLMQVDEGEKSHKEVLVDYLTKQTYNPRKFLNYSMSLYASFQSIPQWHNC